MYQLSYAPNIWQSGKCRTVPVSWLSWQSIFFSWQDFHQFASDKLMIRNEQDIFHQQGFSFRLTKSAILVSKALPQNHSTPFSHFPTDGSWITVWKLRLSYTSNLRSRERNETGRNLHLSLSSRLSRPWKRWIWRLEGGLLKVSR